MPHWAACFRHRENCETTSFLHQRLQNSKNSGRFERQNSTSIAETSHEGKFFQRQKFVIKVAQQYFGRPLRLCPSGCQPNLLDSVASYCAKIIRIWQSMLPGFCVFFFLALFCLRIGGFNVCSPGILLVLDVWAVHETRWSQN